jgi:hypothetical protein
MKKLDNMCFVFEHPCAFAAYFLDLVVLAH